MEKKELTLEELDKYSRKLNKEAGLSCRERVASIKAAKELDINLGSISACLVSDLEELAKYKKIEAGAFKNFINHHTEYGKYKWVHEKNAERDLTEAELLIPSNLCVSLEWGWMIIVLDNHEPTPCEIKYLKNKKNKQLKTNK